MTNTPFSFDIAAPKFIPSEYDNHIKRNLSKMAGQYSDQTAYDKLLQIEDVLLYEVYELKRPELAGEILHGISIVHPGKVGNSVQIAQEVQRVQWYH